MTDSARGRLRSHTQSPRMVVTTGEPMNFKQAGRCTECRVVWNLKPTDWRNPPPCAGCGGRLERAMNLSAGEKTAALAAHLARKKGPVPVTTQPAGLPERVNRRGVCRDCLGLGRFSVGEWFSARGPRCIRCGGICDPAPYEPPPVETVPPAECDEPEPVARRRWHCPGCPVPTALVFAWKEPATGELPIRVTCAGCGKFIRYAPPTAFVVALAGQRPTQGASTQGV